MLPVGFEPTISVGELLKTYALDRAAIGTGSRRVLPQFNWNMTPTYRTLTNIETSQDETQLRGKVLLTYKMIC